MPGMGVATATVILVANSLGRGDKAQMKRIVRESYWISTFLMVLVSGSILLFGQGLSGLFTDNKAAIAASQVVILYSFLGNPVTSGTLVYTAVWQGLGKAKMPFYATTIGMWIIRIFSGYFLGEMCIRDRYSKEFHMTKQTKDVQTVIDELATKGVEALDAMANFTQEQVDHIRCV